MTARPEVPPATPLTHLLDLVDPLGPLSGADTVISGITLDSRRVRPGDLYVAPAGSRAHGADFVPAAVDAGAVAVLTDSDGAVRARSLLGDAPVPLVVVADPRAVLGVLSARVYGEPTRALRMMAVTGTQGKTTTTRLAEAALQQAGEHVACIGTVGTRVDGVELKTSLTTPEAPDLHALFAVMRERGVTGCAMEVSSHALVMGRVDGVVFDVAAFTNLGRDHLDFHASVEEYFLAKASLFTPERARVGLICIDDEHGRRLADEASIPIRTYSVSGPADWGVRDVVAAPDSSSFTLLRDGDEVARLTVPLPGRFNVANAVCAIALAAEAGYDAARVGAALEHSGGVPGRLERVEAGQPFLAVVDYAHKPDAVEAVLHALRPETRGRLIVVIGAGGDRDTGKRPVMGEIASRLADIVIVTDDNPRSEDPASIRAAVVAGADGPAQIHEISDRRLAISRAVELAQPGDTVLVAGKGHETGQEIAGEIRPFDDRDVLREELSRR